MKKEKNDTDKRRGLTRINSYSRSAFDKLERAYSRKATFDGMSYGFDSLDWFTFGIQPDDFIVIAARSSLGKTDFLVNIVENVIGPDSDISVVIFSMKLSAEQIHKRFVCSRGKVRSDHYSMGTLKEIEWPGTVNGSTYLRETPLFVDDSPALSLEEVRQKITAFQSVKEIGLVVIDSLQHLLDVKDQRDTSQVANLSRSIKLLARELEIPILASAHVSGSAQSRFDKRPLIKDLEAWESITEYADVVGFLHPEENYTTVTDDNQFFIPGIEDLDAWEGMTEHANAMGLFHLRKIYNEVKNESRVFECIIRKNLNGGLGKVSLLYEPAFHRFSEVHITDAAPIKN